MEAPIARILSWAEYIIRFENVDSLAIYPTYPVSYEFDEASFDIVGIKYTTMMEFVGVHDSWSIRKNGDPS